MPLAAARVGLRLQSFAAQKDLSPSPHAPKLVRFAVENNELKINRMVAQKDIHFYNSMVEAVNKRMKYDFLFRKQLLDFDCTQRFLEVAVGQYNHRPHSALYGLTPYEVHGRPPDKALFKPQMEQAKILRKAENIALSCHSCVFIRQNQE